MLNLDGFGGIQTLPKALGGLTGLHTLHMRECSELTELQTFLYKDPSTTAAQTVTALEWHPTIPGVFAVALGAKESFNQRLERPCA